MPPRSTSTRQLLPREERRASILRAAARAFVREGFASTSMDDVAAEAGITRLIVYRHFGSKEDLYRAVLERVAGRIQEEFAAAAGSTDPSDFTIRMLLRVAREDPDAFRLLLVHAAREPQFTAYARAAADRAVALADALIGETIPDPVFRRWATRTIVQYLDQSVLGWLDVGEPERDEELVQRATAGVIALYRAITR